MAFASTARSALLHPRTWLIAATILGLALVFVVLPKYENDSARKTAANPVTPGVFTGLGFDQCQAPKQSAMDTWKAKSPFKSVGIYISGDSRACRKQTYLNSTWVATQLANGWHLLPIALGPQPSCLARFPRYDDDFSISSASANSYRVAREQGNAEAVKNVNDAKKLGIVPGSTIFYDLEGFTYTNTACRESALRFVSSWNAKVKSLGYRAGFYSSAGSGIKMVDQARIKKTAGITLPDVLWLARYDNKANTSAPDYLSEDGWQGARIKQFQGGHNETWGGVTINIDRNYLDLRSAPTIKPAPPAPTKASTPKPTPTPVPVVPAETHCGGVKVDYLTYPQVRKASTTFTPSKAAVKALTCLLSERTDYSGPVSTTYNTKLQSWVRAWHKAHGKPVNTMWTYQEWMWLFAQGKTETITKWSTGPRVRDLQRAMNAANATNKLPITGAFDSRSFAVLKSWRTSVGMETAKAFAAADWKSLRYGKR